MWANMWGRQLSLPIDIPSSLYRPMSFKLIITKISERFAMVILVPELATNGGTSNDSGSIHHGKFVLVHLKELWMGGDYYLQTWMQG